MSRKGLYRIAGLVLMLALSAGARALDPLPDVYHGAGYISWQVRADAPLWRMETLLERLRDPNIADRRKAMHDIGYEQGRVGRELMWPEITQPIKVEEKWLGIERRKLAVLTAPVKGSHAWTMVIFRQDSNDEAYWRPFQFLKFDTEPTEGLVVDFPDINGELIYFMQVKHVVKDDVYGWRKVDSIFKFDEKQLRLTYQEPYDYYRNGKFQGDPLRLSQKLTFKGDQRIRRELTIKTYPFMPGPDFYNYEEHNVKPRHTEKASERFSWDPQNFSFYNPIDELEKLVGNKSAFVRREAARRLGEVLKTTHPQLEKAMLTDKDAYVRSQCALALENIGDVAALPSVEKALKKYDEPETMEEAYQRAFDRLSALKAAQPTPEATLVPAPKPKPNKKKTDAKAGALAPIATEGPKVTDKK